MPSHRRRTELGLIFAGAIAITASTAAMAGEFDAEIAAIVEIAEADWTAILSCSVLDPESHDPLRAFWEDELVTLAQLLEAADVDPELAAASLARLSVDAVMVLTEGDVATLAAYCADTNWRYRAAILDFIRPAREIEQLIGR